MKVVSSQEMKRLEERAYRAGHQESAFMELAGKGVALFVHAFLQSAEEPVWLLCGKGNNGGDAFVAGRFLLERGYRVTAIQPEAEAMLSPLCQKNRALFLASGGALEPRFTTSPSSGIIVDGFFGTGFRGKIEPPYEREIKIANQSALPIFSIDIPSGLNGTSGEVLGEAIRAETTLFLALPKTGFFLGQGWDYVGNLVGVDFGLPLEMMEEAAASFHFLQKKDLLSALPPVCRSRHKYEAGYVIAIAGSPSMPGAALLSSLAALRSGCGLVRLLHPRGMEPLLACSPYEIIKTAYETKEELLSHVDRAHALFVGPGLGREKEVGALLRTLFADLSQPLVVDADALTAYASEPFALPQEVIFTPHKGEMRSLLQATEPLKLDLKLLDRCQAFAEQRRVTLILKGAPTFIFQAGQPIAAIGEGDPGMATAGSGDVLTGILASLLSQGVKAHAAALLGVTLHGLCGKIAARKRGTSRGVIASDLIDALGEAYASWS